MLYPLSYEGEDGLCRKLVGNLVETLLVASSPSEYSLSGAGQGTRGVDMRTRRVAPYAAIAFVGGGSLLTPPRLFARYRVRELTSSGKGDGFNLTGLRKLPAMEHGELEVGSVPAPSNSSMSCRLTS